MNRKRISIALAVVWAGIAILFLVFAIPYGENHPSAWPLITTVARGFGCSIPLLTIATGFIEGRERVFRTVIGIPLFVFLVWLAFFSPLAASSGIS